MPFRQAKPTFGEFTEEESKKIREAVHRTYGVIADDAQIPESWSVAKILEIVLDASYVRTYGRIEDELYDRFDKYVMSVVKSNKSFSAAMRRLAKEVW